MKQPLFPPAVFAIWLVLACMKAGGQPPRHVEAPPSEGVLREVARRSGLPESEVQELVANCDRDQQSLYFCAFRDFVARDLLLQSSAAEKQRQLPACAAELGQKLSEREHARDENCRRSAAEEYGEGSMKLQAQATCAASATQELVERVQAVKDCASLAAF
jgi:hypothetical protein